MEQNMLPTQLLGLLLRGCCVSSCMSKRALEWAQKPTLCLTQPHSTKFTCGA